MTQFKQNEISLSHQTIQMLPSEDGKYILVSSYDSKHEKHQISVYDTLSLTLEQQNTINSNKNLVVKCFDENIWISIRFIEDNNPNIVDVNCYTWSKNDPVLELPNVSIRQATPKCIVIDHPTIEGKLVYLNPIDGSPLSNMPDSDTTSDIKFPQVYFEDNEYFNWFTKALQKINIQPQQQVEYLKAKEYLIISTITNGQLDVFILNNELDLVYQTNVLSAVTETTIDNFFLINDRFLIINKEKSILSLDLKPQN